MNSLPAAIPERYVPPYCITSLNLKHDQSEQTANPSQPSTFARPTKPTLQDPTLQKSLSAPTPPRLYFFVQV